MGHHDGTHVPLHLTATHSRKQQTAALCVPGPRTLRGCKGKGRAGHRCHTRTPQHGVVGAGAGTKY
eukprot:6898396-Prymnesium_polylepis.1